MEQPSQDVWGAELGIVCGHRGEGGMTKRSGREGPPTRFVPPPTLLNSSRPGDRGTSDPFRQFKLAARDNGKPYKSAEPKAEQGLLNLLATKAALVVMGCLLAAVVAILLVLVLIKTL
jgi:hypothetical protein